MKSVQLFHLGFIFKSQICIWAAKATPKPLPTINPDPFAQIRSNSTNGYKADGTIIFREIAQSGWILLSILIASGYLFSLLISGIRLVLNPSEYGGEFKQIVKVKSMIFICFEALTIILGIAFNVIKNLV